LIVQGALVIISSILSSYKTQLCSSSVMWVYWASIHTYITTNQKTNTRHIPFLIFTDCSLIVDDVMVLLINW